MHRAPAWWASRKLSAIAWLPLAGVFGVLSALRRGLFRAGVLRRDKLPVPVIVVGNVAVGGSGKTPVVAWLAGQLRAAGHVPGIVSRGYGAAVGGVALVGADSDPRAFGDEPVLLAQLTGCPVAVGVDRPAAARALLKAHPECSVIISDDGLQHYRLRRDVEIVVLDEATLGNRWLLPAGPLREPWPRAVDFLLCAGAVPPGGSAPAFALERRLADTAIAADGRRVPLADLAGQALVAVAGTARPEEFFAMLRARGLAPTQTFALPDHFDFDSWNPNTDKRQRLVCTEKDAPKLWPRFPDALAVPLELAIAPAFFAALDERLAQTAQRPLSSPARPPG